MAVLQAPPGAGKTTGVPLHLIQQNIVGGKIIMLEPRRVAARAAADRLAAGLGEQTGRSVGFRMRGEQQTGSRIEVVTEGILIRMIQADPDMPGVGCIIFDEFHERTLQADLGLALALELRAALRPDMKLIVMSATLDAEPVAALMGNAPVISAEGRAFEVETCWLDRPWARGGGVHGAFESAMADLTQKALMETQGGVLVFLPGQAEIFRTSRLLAGSLPKDTDLLYLHGGLRLAEQRAVLAPSQGRRKLVLSTSIAETSLTIPDIRVVVDGGLARRPRFDAASGMTRLVTERLSRAEATQRRGRAGRVGPGWCYRLWAKAEHGALGAFAPPGIATADLASLALELAGWGVATPDELAFLTPPPTAALAAAQGLLHDLGAVDAEGRITSHGRALLPLPVHPRLAHMLVVAAEMGAGRTAGQLAALLEAGDPIRGTSGAPPADLTLRLKALDDPAAVRRDNPVSLDDGSLAAIRSEAKRLTALVPGSATRKNPAAAAVLSLAYPDRIAMRRPGTDPRYLMSGGKGAVIRPGDPLATFACLVIADLDGDQREALVRRALPANISDIEALHMDRICNVSMCEWSRRDRQVVARHIRKLGALVLDEKPWPDAPADSVSLALIAGIRDIGLQCLPWTDQARRFAARVEWLRAAGSDLPDFSDHGLSASLEHWLTGHLAGLRRIDGLARVNLVAALKERLNWAEMDTLDRLAPAEISAPTGTRLAVDYSGDSPSVSVRLQEMFGLTRHPTIGPDRIPLLIHLLSPARRPVQSTSDLPGFWQNSYADVRRDLRGRYLRHPWPENPADAEPTRRTKNQRT